MRKSSIYLPDELKVALAELAGRTGRSEADLIRTAIERLVTTGSEPPSAPEASSRPSAPPALAAPAAFVAPRPALVGVGMGPGDPGLVTGRARAVLAAADRVLVTSTDAHSVGRAEMVLRSVAPSARLTRVPFTITADPGGRQASLDDLAATVVGATDAGELVAVAVLGDPAQWTIFPALARLVCQRRPSLHVEAVPGITAYQSVAGRPGCTLGESGTALCVVDNLAALDHALADRAVCAVLFKASTDADALRAVAARHGRTALVGELTGLPGETVAELSELADGPLSYLATVVFPATSSHSVGAASSHSVGAA